MNTTIKQLADEIEKLSKNATMNLDEVPYAVRAGWASTIENSKTKLKEVERQYSREIARNAAAVMLLGDQEKATRLGAIIKENNEGFVLDASEMYRRIAQQIVPSLPDRAVEWGINQTSLLNGALRDVMHELGVNELPMPDRIETPTVRTFDDVLKHVRRVIRNASGDSLNKTYLEKRLVEQALEIRYTGAVVQVIVVGATEDDAYDLGRMFGFGCYTETLGADDVIDKELMLAVFERATETLSREKGAAISRKGQKKEEPKKQKQKLEVKTKRVEANNTAGADGTTDAQAQDEAEDQTNDKE